MAEIKSINTPVVKYLAANDAAAASSHEEPDPDIDLFIQIIELW